MTHLYLIAKVGLVGAFSGAAFIIAEGASYTNTVSLGALIIAAVVSFATLVGVIYGVRYRTLAKTLEQERDAEHARGNRIDRDLGELKAMHQEQLAKHEAYRDEKHRAVNELSTQVKKCQSELEMERQKHDYSHLVASVASLNQELQTRTPLFDQLIQGQRETTEALGKIVTALDALLLRTNGA